MQEDNNLNSSHTYLIVDERENSFPKCFNRIRCAKVKPAHKPSQKREHGHKQTSKERSSKEDIDKLENLIENGPDVNVNNVDGENVLHIVARLEPKDSIKYFDLLIKKKNKLINKYRDFFIHVAAYNNNDVLIEHILKKHPNLLFDAESKWKQETPLHIAAKTGSKEAVLCLIKNGANKEARDYLERTPLFLAAEYQEAEVVKILIDEGCDVQAKNFNGQKALYWIVAKCPQLAPEILDRYRNLDKYAYKDIYYLKKMDLEPIVVAKEIKEEESRNVYRYCPVKLIDVTKEIKDEKSGIVFGYPQFKSIDVTKEIKDEKSGNLYRYCPDKSIDLSKEFKDEKSGIVYRYCPDKSIDVTNEFKDEKSRIFYRYAQFKSIDVSNEIIDEKSRIVYRYCPEKSIGVTKEFKDEKSDIVYRYYPDKSIDVTNEFKDEKSRIFYRYCPEKSIDATKEFKHEESGFFYRYPQIKSILSICYLRTVIYVY
ncbi:transient receptor potential channel pyrexia-like [Brachionus plicatilis]|uniref:Transient receptor potential channel pyrexia-like n=1 Tax=Brachionus plicatilis TaxID=10195 RepID=A0A3M7Q307_BRAPC|nr:transient receptor potential channel pyrexia-like [Brachionus plicatilis]